jgi:hypothetical protein
MEHYKDHDALAVDRHIGIDASSDTWEAADVE